MCSSVDQVYIEELQQQLKTTCEKLEERRYESIVVTVSQDSHWMTGSEKGKTFLEDKLLFISEFVQFCEGPNLPVICKLEADADLHNEVEVASNKTVLSNVEATGNTLHTPVPLGNAQENTFDDDTDDYDDTANLSIVPVNKQYTETDTKKENNLEEIKGTGKISRAVEVICRPNRSESNSKRKGSEILKTKETKVLKTKMNLARLKASKTKSNNNILMGSKGNLICSICKANFLTQEILDAHMESHKSLSCCICKREFETQASLTEHKQTHVDNNEYHECKQCEKVFKLSWQLNEHFEKVHVNAIELEKGQFPCCRCGYVFKFESHLNEHDRLMPNCKSEIPAQVKKSDLICGQVSYKDPVSGEMKKKWWKELLDKREIPAECEICLKTIDNMSNYRRHVLLHSDLKAFKCYICNKDFKSEDNLKKHLKQHDARPYHCSHCHWRFNTKSRRDFHVRFTCTKLKDKPDLVCSECGYQFASQSALKDHQLSHTGIKPWNCDQCTYSSSNKRNLYVHKLRTHQVRKWNYKCEQCGIGFTVKGRWTRHMKTHGELSIKCEVCEKGFLDEGSRERHMKVHGEKKQYVCELCPRTFERPARLREHMRQHTGERPFICEICAMAFNRNARLIEHRRVHTGEKPYKCDFQDCNKTFGTLGSLKQHKKSHIPNQCFICDYCGRTFKTTRTLNYHRKNHTVEWRWPCIYCEKKYKSIAVYKNHLSNSHPEMKDNIEQRTNIKLHQCHICLKTYSKTLDLRRHIFIHQGLKPFKCQYCGKAFNDKSNMKVHEKLHTEDKRYQCNLCCKKFVHPRGLKVHQHNVHGTKTQNNSELNFQTAQSI